MGAGQPKPTKVNSPTVIENRQGPFKMQENQNTYPAIIEFNLDSNGDGSSVSWWTVILIAAGTLLLLYIVKRIRECHRNVKLRSRAEQVRFERLEAIALAPVRPLQYHPDRFQEVNEAVVEPLQQAPSAPPMELRVPQPVGTQRRNR